MSKIYGPQFSFKPLDHLIYEYILLKMNILLSLFLVRGENNSNKTHICVNLGFFSGASSCERQIFDMMKSQLSFVDSVYS